jgi:5-methylcytosine-specific restriction endonuclease McrA
MPPRRKNRMSKAQAEKILAQAHTERANRAESYRERALKLFPHVCARCGREFAGKDLRELTVHHKDSDHHNNPPDGSNWELLCVYCHDNEHQRALDGSAAGTALKERGSESALGFNAFEGLETFLPEDENAGE